MTDRHSIVPEHRRSSGSAYDDLTLKIEYARTLVRSIRSATDEGDSSFVLLSLLDQELRELDEISTENSDDWHRPDEPKVRSIHDSHQGRNTAALGPLSEQAVSELEDIKDTLAGIERIAHEAVTKGVDDPETMFGVIRREAASALKPLYGDLWDRLMTDLAVSVDQQEPRHE